MCCMTQVSVVTSHKGRSLSSLLGVCSTRKALRTMTDCKVTILIGYFIGIWGVASIQTKADSPYHNCHVSDTASRVTTHVHEMSRWTRDSSCQLDERLFWAQKVFARTSHYSIHVTLTVFLGDSVFHRPLPVSSWSHCFSQFMTHFHTFFTLSLSQTVSGTVQCVLALQLKVGFMESFKGKETILRVA